MTNLMGADLNNIVKCQKLTDDHIQFLIYQLLRGLKVTGCKQEYQSRQPKCCSNDWFVAVTVLKHFFFLCLKSCR